MRIYKRTIEERRYDLNKAGDLLSFLADSELIENVSIQYTDDDTCMVDNIVITVDLDGFRKDFYERNYDFSTINTDYGMIVDTITDGSRKIVLENSPSPTRGRMTFDSNDLARAGSINLRNPIDVLSNLDDVSQCCDTRISHKDDQVIIALTPRIENYISGGRYSLIGN